MRVPMLFSLAALRGLRTSMRLLATQPTLAEMTPGSPEMLARAKKGAILVNTARGPIVDDAALIDALDAGRIGTAILDVFHTEPLPTDDPLWAHPNIRMTPHTSFAGDGVQDRWDKLFLENLLRYVNGEELFNVFKTADLT